VQQKGKYFLREIGHVRCSRRVKTS
jgi:hypothetical protein